LDAPLSTATLGVRTSQTGFGVRGGEGNGKRKERAKRRFFKRRAAFGPPLLRYIDRRRENLTEKSARKNAFLSFIAFKTTFAVSVLSPYFAYFPGATGGDERI